MGKLILVFEPEAQCWLLMASRLPEQGKFNRGHRWQSCRRNHTLPYRDLATHNISMTKEHRPRADRRDTLNSELWHETWLLLLPNESRLSCGALKRDSFHNLRAPPASSAC